MRDKITRIAVVKNFSGDAVRSSKYDPQSTVIKY